ncbi:hypothetical protein ACP70R_026789 [Stipagrostis hirtigluma subsp. patula]
MASPPSDEKKMVRLRSSDGESFDVLEEHIGAASTVIRGMLDDGCADGVITLPNVAAPVLSRVLEYVNRHFDPAEAAFAVAFNPSDKDGPLARFDNEFVSVPSGTLIDLINAASYLNIDGLLDLTCEALANQYIKGKTTEEIRKTFDIVNDYTKEEEQEVRRENSWAFE